MTDRAVKDGKILLVDDDKNVLDVTCRLLELSGYSVVSASSGRQGLELFRQSAHEFVAAIIDLTMPEMDGVEVFEELRQIRPELRAILSSGFDQQTAEAQYGNRGFAGFLQKPYTTKVLVQKIEDVLA